MPYGVIHSHRARAWHRWKVSGSRGGRGNGRLRPGWGYGQSLQLSNRHSNTFTTDFPTGLDGLLKISMEKALKYLLKSFRICLYYDREIDYNFFGSRMCELRSELKVCLTRDQIVSAYRDAGTGTVRANENEWQHKKSQGRGFPGKCYNFGRPMLNCELNATK